MCMPRRIRNRLRFVTDSDFALRRKENTILAVCQVGRNEYQYPRRQFAPQDLVLQRELTDLPSEFVQRRAGDEKQPGLVEVPHGMSLRKLKRHKKMTSFSHAGLRFGRQIPAASLRRGNWATVGRVVVAAA
jgi:hypothetical protein